MPARSGSSPTGRGPAFALRSRRSKRRFSFSLVLSACALSRARLFPDGREFFAINNSFYLIVSQEFGKCLVTKREQRAAILPDQGKPLSAPHLRKIDATKCEVCKEHDRSFT